ncbi:hypothetical protein PC121_g16072 [Phytophthora cactorum]|nr:hypothetical protein PC121_g16072 [Phytophthora cactorum]
MLRVATTCAVSAECKQRAFEAWLDSLAERLRR